MNILAIETSCDETSVAIVRSGTEVLSCIISSQIATFQEKGGVIPEEAARNQVEYMLPVLHGALEQSKIQWNDIDAIAVTRGPGLFGSLLVGTTTARALASLHRKPLIGVHHTFGHLSSPWLGIADTPCFPLLTLSASGGHTDMWLRTSHTKGTLIGRTRDDAAGEAFDKGASMLGLPYPGGPSIAKAALEGNEKAFSFPLPLKEEDSLDYSFSGLKTSLKYAIRNLQDQEIPTADLAASFQYAICHHLVERLKKALQRHPEVREVHLVGGVSANIVLRKMVGELCSKEIILRVPTTMLYCTDNAAMIGAAAYFLHQEQGDDAFIARETCASISLEETLLQ